MALVAAGLVGADGEGGVEQQHALVGPGGEVAAGGGEGGAEVGVDFGDDVFERRRHGDAMRHREAEAHGLAGLMVGVLAEDDHADTVERGAVEGGKYLAARGIAGVLAAFLHQEFLQLGEVGRFELRAEDFVPAGVYLDCHNIYFLTANSANLTNCSRWMISGKLL